MRAKNGPCVVFVVQSESSLRDFIERVLHDHGALVFSASTPQSALHFLKNYRGDIHLVIVDRHMSGGGLDLANRIVRERSAARVVLMCEANGDGLPEEWKERLLSAPVQAEALRRQVEHALSTAPCDHAPQAAQVAQAE